MLTYVTSAKRQIQRSVTTAVFIVICFSAFLLFQGCGTTLQFSVVETPSQVSKSKVTYESFDKSMTWEGVKISIPGKVARADLDNGSRAVLFDYSENSEAKSKDMLLYDFAQDSVMWSAKCLTSAESGHVGRLT